MAIWPAGNAGQKAQAVTVFAEGDGDEAGGDGELQPIGPADEKPDGARAPAWPADKGRRHRYRRAELDHGHGVDGDEQPAAQPDEKDQRGPGEPARDHARVAHDAGPMTPPITTARPKPSPKTRRRWSVKRGRAGAAWSDVANDPPAVSRRRYP